ncbi:hypothetical protein BX600DRAFT_429104 [Xylariales sp. PMI_506]|nr:hypothetical protein BX600DRAFT_429104 [Xylariales sp. PMI_506]
MARDSKNKDKSKSKDVEEKALPRPGTSGTENLLITTRRQASEQFAKAHRAEKAYRAKKRAELARNNYTETKDHFKSAFKHFGLGFKGIFSVVAAVPYIIGEKREKRRKKSEAAKRQRDLEKKKKLEEALARNSVATEDEAASS